MKNELFKNEEISLVAYTNKDYVDYVLNETEGQPIKSVLLPYRLHGGHLECLVQKKMVEGWDAHSDICGLRYGTVTDFLEGAVLMVSKLGFKVGKEDIYPLGILQEGLYSNRSIHLTAVQLTRFVKQEAVSSLEDAEIVWIRKDDLLKSVDPFLIGAFARLNEYL